MPVQWDSSTAEEIAQGGFTDAAKAATVRRINGRFPYINPTDIKDIVSDSVDGLFRELSRIIENAVE